MASASGELLWLPLGKQHSFEDLVFWQGKSSGQTFEEVAGRFDTVVSGPHAGAAIPEELRLFVSQTLTRRKQHDYSDIITGPVGRAWAEVDPYVVFVENPHSRVVLDPNRSHEGDAEPALREFFSRLRRQRSGEAGVNFKGVDAVRPVTFSGEDVIVEPTEDSWPQLAEALRSAAALGALAYDAALERVMEAVLAARKDQPVPLTLVCLHDTNNFKMRADGALVVERPEAERLPTLANFGNLGDATGEGLPDTVSTAGPEMRRIAEAWSQAFGTESQDSTKPASHAHLEAISFNRPYAGGYEMQMWWKRLQEKGLGQCPVYQVEFERSALLGPAAAKLVKLPGADWPAVDTEHVGTVAQKLKSAGDLLRAGRLA